MKKLAIVAMMLLVGVGAYIWWPSDDKGQKTAQQSAARVVDVAVVTLKPENIDLYQELPGRTQAFKIAEIRPQVSGIVTKRLFEEGSDVKEGQQLYQIDPAPYKATYDSAMADLEKAEANIKSTEAKTARYAELVKIGGVSKQEYDDIVATLQQSKADVAIAKAAVARAKINLDYTKVFSPISGRIGKSSVTEGALVTAEQAAPLAVVQQLDKIYVDVTQSVADLRRMQRFLENGGSASAQASATLTIEGESEPYSEQGLLQFADVTVDQGTGTVQLRILFENPKIDLLPGLFVKARVTQAQKADAILVSQQAVTRNADGSTTVWRIGEDDKAQIRPITVSRVVGDRWLVAEGLSAGDRVVVEGGQKLKPDTAVKAVEQSTATLNKKQD
ncbi:efflux RND transporter periplasmic adaptor subunit [Micavibrio aeruginosavorus]|uniref:RND efflux system, membrane fusion protein CmeA n=1 Tax=Micavibrio aeruginosavorus EPB TaxID=349215 RepID=M4VHP8_9BACT|nr:efflux RND transporter periplasmic adaptor subunit [Micavibrio aeruginosavorus]AGH98927.1 RND efflux system, membrane fusion protein CmeA [Micavibrio aeruginosavorus EPB]